MAHTPVGIEHLLQRYGDDLYRLALLLAPNASDAAAIIVRAVQRLAAAPPDAPVEADLIHALVAALPPERSRRLRRPLPEWVVAAPDDYAATGVALARLRREQRLALGLLALQQWDAEQIAQFTNGDVIAAQALIRDALLALAPQAAPHADLAAMRGEFAPIACRATRAALGMNDAALRHDPAVRGHLALCSACRAVENDWQRLSTTVEDALRSALRPERMPVTFSVQLRDMLAAQAQPPNDTPRPFNGWRRALLPLSIIALIALLIFPKARPTAPEANTAASSLAPIDLAQRAAANLYQPPANERAQHPYDAWHAQWQVRWDFSDTSYAMLNGDLWRDMASSRHRAQLVHEKGGGPFEFELADGKNLVYYATTENYGNSLYPLVFERDNARLALQVPADEQARMLEARLNAGAWGLAQAYLQRAIAAHDLRSWGQQRNPDGSMVEVLGFRGMSPSGLPAGAPSAADNAPTILLTIGLADGALREVRELVGPPGGEQIGQTIWRFMGGEWISASPQISAAFSLEQAWNGIGSFRNTGQRLANLALPIVTSDEVRPLADAITDQWSWGWLPSAPPPGVTSALLFERLIGSSDPVNGTVVYMGAGRYLALESGWQYGTGVPNVLDDTLDRIEQDDKTLYIQSSAHQQQDAIVLPHGQPNPPDMFIRLSAQGFSRAELLQIISGLRPLDPKSYQSQVRLFSDAQHNDPAAFAALLGALASAAPPPNTVRHVTARVFQRHGDQVDTLNDPYHRPPNGGMPEAFIKEMWLRADNDGDVQEVAYQLRAPDGPLFQSSYSGPDVNWAYNATTNSAQQYNSWENTGASLTTGQMTVLRMLSCGGAQLATQADGRRAVVKREEDWNHGSCMHPEYSSLIARQRPDTNMPFIEEGPFLLDISLNRISPLTTWLYLNESNQPTGVEVRAGRDSASIRIESWERIGDEQAPPTMISAMPPPALIMDDYTKPWTQPEALIGTPTITEAARIAQTTLWQLPTNELTRFVQAQTAAPGNTLPSSSNDIFEHAVRRGVAIQLIYQHANENGMSQIEMCQGSAQQFGGFLRAQAHWEGSQAVQLRAAGHDIDGWQVVAPDGSAWTLFEIDGTLIAVNQPAELIDSDAFDHMQPFK